MSYLGSKSSPKSQVSSPLFFNSTQGSGNTSSSVFQSIIFKFNLSIMFRKIVHTFSVYLHVLGTQLSKKFSSQCIVVGIAAPSFNTQLFQSSFEDEWSLEGENVTPRTQKKLKMQIFRSYRCQRRSQLRTIIRLTVRKLTPLMGQSTFSPQSQIMIEQYGPSFKLRSIN